MTTPNPQYEPNIPRVGDDLATSQGQFLINFMQLYSAFSQNHAPLDSSTLTPGNHTVVELLGSATGFQTDVSEVSIYAKPIAGQTNQLFMRYQGNGTEVSITNYQIYSIPPTPQRSQFFTFLPGGILIYYGLVDIFGYPFLLDLNPPVAKNIISVNLCGAVTPGLKASYPPRADPVTSTDGIIRQLKLYNSLSLAISELMFYMVMVNI